MYVFSSIGNVMKQFKTLRQRKYWHSIKSLSSPDRLLPFIDFIRSSINITFDDQQMQFSCVYNSPSTAYAFCISHVSIIINQIML